MMPLVYLATTALQSGWYPEWKAGMDQLFAIGMGLAAGYFLLLFMFIVVSSYQQSN